jgi:serine protease Do
MSRWSITTVCLLSGAVGGIVADRALQLSNAAPAPLTVPAIPKELTSYRDIVKNVLPAVVSIEGRVKAKVRPMNQPRGRGQLDDPRIPEEYRRFFEQFPGQAVPFGGGDGAEETPNTGFGSGFIVDPKGLIMTNFHVVNGADSVEIRLADGRKFVSNDFKVDRKTDLAIIKVDTKDNLPYLELGDSEATEIGDRVLAVGAPFGLTGTVTHGIISAKGRNGLHMNMYEDFIQTDAAINPGNSGGPLVSLDGKVIGIDAAIKSRSGGFQGIGLAVSSNLAKNVMKQLLENGTVKRGYLGVQIKPLDPEVAAKLGVKDGKGVVVGQVFENTPASKGGLVAGDVITSVNGKAIKDARDLQLMIAGLPVGKPVDVNVLRDGKAQALKVTIDAQPDEFGDARAPAAPAPRRDKNSVNMDGLGMSVTDMTPEMAQQLGFKDKLEGAVVSHVDSGSAAFEAGLRRGMVITRVDKQTVKSADTFKEAMTKADREKGVLLQVQSPRGGTDYVVVKPTAESKK